MIQFAIFVRNIVGIVIEHLQLWRDNFKNWGRQNQLLVLDTLTVLHQFAQERTSKQLVRVLMRVQEHQFDTVVKKLAFPEVHFSEFLKKIAFSCLYISIDSKAQAYWLWTAKWMLISWNEIIISYDTSKTCHYTCLGFWGRVIFGPFFFKNWTDQALPVNGARYCDMVIQFFVLKMQDMDVADMVFFFI